MTELTTRENRIAIQVHNAQLIDTPKGYEAVIKSSVWTDGEGAEFFGFHFEKKGTHKIGDTIDNGGGIVSTIVEIV